MRQRKQIIGIYIMFVCLLASCIPVTITKAASATVTISLRQSKIKLHDTFTVIVDVEADEAIGGFEAFLSYDEKRMKFKEGGSEVSGDDGIIRISDMNPENLVTSRKYVLQFTAIGQGNAQIETMDQAYVYTYENSAEMSVSCNKLSVNIETDEKVSKNNKLYSLRISPGKLTPNFDPKTTHYTTEVFADVKELIVSAVAQEGGANVKTTGIDDLKPGMNEAKIIVTAPSGDKKTYSIEINKLSIDSNPNNEDDQDQKADDITEEENQKKLKDYGYLINEEEGSITVEFDAKYTVVPLEDDTLIPEGYEVSKMILDKIEVPVYERIGKEPSDYLLLYMIGKDGVPRFYRYDKVENTVQRYVPSYDEESQNHKNTMTQDTYARKLNNMKILVAISCAITLIATLVVVRLLIKNHGVKDDDF